MAELEYMHICDHAFVTDGGKQCIIGIFEQVFASNFPATHASMFVAARLTGTPNEPVAVKVEIGRPNGDALASAQANITIGQDAAANLQVNFIGVQFPEAGRYTVKVSVAGKTLRSQSLHLRKMTSAPSAQGTQGPVH